VIRIIRQKAMGYLFCANGGGIAYARPTYPLFGESNSIGCAIIE
jgi:hypothetical protein